MPTNPEQMVVSGPIDQVRALSGFYGVEVADWVDVVVGGGGMTGRPSGTVTFLFTDIEGSTRRWEADPDRMRGR